MENALIDVHMHLIPGVDDGAEDIEHALTMFLQARDQGVTAVFATPHSNAFDRYPQETAERFGQLRNWISALYLGCEVYCEAAGMDEVVQALRENRYPTMNGTDYVLIEFPQGISPEDAIVCVKVLLEADYRPILAHAERYPKLRSMNCMEHLHCLGCLLQVNVYSLFDEENEDIKNFARELALKERISFLGTDAHRTTYRPPSVKWGMNWLYQNCDRVYADRISRKNAQTLLLDK